MQFETFQSLAEILRNRGPNVQHQISLSNGVTFYGFVLWQQGDRPAKQPLESDKFILLFNGDIFNATKDNTVSDTTWLISKLDECNVTNFRGISAKYFRLFVFMLVCRMKRIYLIY